jgi:hypothetical protein
MVTSEQRREINRNRSSDIKRAEHHEVIPLISEGLTTPARRVVPPRLGTGRELGIQVLAGVFVEGRSGAKGRLVVLYITFGARSGVTHVPVRDPVDLSCIG